MSGTRWHEVQREATATLKRAAEAKGDRRVELLEKASSLIRQAVALDERRAS